MEKQYIIKNSRTQEEYESFSSEEAAMKVLPIIQKSHPEAIIHTPPQEDDDNDTWEIKNAKELFDDVPEVEFGNDLDQFNEKEQRPEDLNSDFE